MKEQIQKRLSDSKAARWTALIIVSFTMMCGYFLTDVVSPLENLLTTRGSVAYFTDDTSMPTDSLLAKMELLAADAASPSLTVDNLEKGLRVQFLDKADGNQQVVEKTIATVAS
ncbi:MAG: MFS transporter, partial [Bacteroides sp.]|nr:MFS transporter [Bacteroides sp.]